MAVRSSTAHRRQFRRALYLHDSDNKSKRGRPAKPLDVLVYFTPFVATTLPMSYPQEWLVLYLSVPRI